MKTKASFLITALALLSVLSLSACKNEQPAQSAQQSGSQSELSGDSSSDSTSADASSQETSSQETTSQEMSSQEPSYEDEPSDEDTSSTDTSSEADTSEDNTSDDTSSDDKTSDSTSDDTSSDDDIPDDTPTVPSGEKGAVIANTAEQMLGKPFTEGGYTPETGFDNSGLIYYALTQAGVENVPRGLTGQLEMGTEVPKEQLQPGDIVFITDGDFYFGSVYTGDNTIVFSPFPGQNVRTADLNSVYYLQNYYKAIRVG